MTSTFAPSVARDLLNYLTLLRREFGEPPVWLELGENLSLKARINGATITFLLDDWGLTNDEIGFRALDMVTALSGKGSTRFELGADANYVYLNQRIATGELRQYQFYRSAPLKAAYPMPNPSHILFNRNVFAHAFLTSVVCVVSNEESHPDRTGVYLERHATGDKCSIVSADRMALVEQTVRTLNGHEIEKLTLPPREIAFFLTVAKGKTVHLSVSGENLKFTSDTVTIESPVHPYSFKPEFRNLINEIKPDATLYFSSEKLLAALSAAGPAGFQYGHYTDIYISPHEERIGLLASAVNKLPERYQTTIPARADAKWVDDNELPIRDRIVRFATTDLLRTLPIFAGNPVILEIQRGVKAARMHSAAAQALLMPVEVRQSEHDSIKLKYFFNK
jgi:hypothetical protein